MGRTAQSMVYEFADCQMVDEGFLEKRRMKKIFFPWLDSRLSPNKRIDRRALIGAKRDAKHLAMALTWERKLAVLETDLQIKITFCPPDKRRRDLDNLYATFKAYQDGIFEALALDDSLIDRIILQRGELVKNGCVVVELEEA